MKDPLKSVNKLKTHTHSVVAHSIVTIRFGHFRMSILSILKNYEIRAILDQDLWFRYTRRESNISHDIFPCILLHNLELQTIKQ